jgi:hypothetical protein
MQYPQGDDDEGRREGRLGAVMRKVRVGNVYGELMLEARGLASRKFFTRALCKT